MLQAVVLADSFSDIPYFRPLTHVRSARMLKGRIVEGAHSFVCFLHIYHPPDVGCSVTQERPKVLLPVVNVPMIEYALEFLVSGVFSPTKRAVKRQYDIQFPVAEGLRGKRANLNPMFIRCPETVGGVDQIFIFASSHADQIEDYLKVSNTTHARSLPC